MTSALRLAKIIFWFVIAVFNVAVFDVACKAVNCCCIFSSRSNNSPFNLSSFALGNELLFATKFWIIATGMLVFSFSTLATGSRAGPEAIFVIESSAFFLFPAPNWGFVMALSKRAKASELLWVIPNPFSYITPKWTIEFGFESSIPFLKFAIAFS